MAKKRIAGRFRIRTLKPPGVILDVVMRVPEVADRDFTASAFVVNDGQVLLIHHAKLGQWLQPGGHIEPRETPDEAAKREVEEETGVSMRIHEDYRPETEYPTSEDLPEPFQINLHEVRDDHWHVDFAFLGVVEDLGRPRETNEHNGQRWLSLDALADLSPIDENTRRMAERAILEGADD